MMWILLSFLGIHLLFPLRNMKCYFIGILCISVSLPHMVTKQKHMRGNTDALIPKWKGKQKKKKFKQHIYYSPTRFLPTVLFASPAFTPAPLWSASLMSQLYRRENISCLAILPAQGWLR